MFIKLNVVQTIIYFMKNQPPPPAWRLHGGPLTIILLTFYPARYLTSIFTNSKFLYYREPQLKESENYSC